MSHHSDLIDTTEMYLRTVYELEEEGVVPLRARIAERLGQSGPTVSQTVARMERDGLVHVADDRHLQLTDLGRREATGVMRKHRIAERLLADIIGLDWEDVHIEACRWEHVMSEAVERRIVALLDKPLVCPHGNPIPGLDELGLPFATTDHPEGLLTLTARLPSPRRARSRSTASASRSSPTRSVMHRLKTAQLRPGGHMHVRAGRRRGRGVDARQAVRAFDAECQRSHLRPPRDRLSPANGPCDPRPDRVRREADGAGPVRSWTTASHRRLASLPHQAPPRDQKRRPRRTHRSATSTRTCRPGAGAPMTVIERFEVAHDPQGFLKHPRVDTPKRPAAERVRDWQPIYLRAAREVVNEQAARCMDCGVAFCHSGCPLGNLIPEWNEFVARDDYAGASDRLHATNNFPEFTGWICPAPCEAACVLALNTDPVTIKQVEVSDRRAGLRGRPGDAAAADGSDGHFGGRRSARGRPGWPRPSSSRAPGTT